VGVLKAGKGTNPNVFKMKSSENVLYLLLVHAGKYLHKLFCCGMVSLGLTNL